MTELHDNEIKRGCFNCKNCNVCFVFRDVQDTMKGMRINIDGNAAPGKYSDVFHAIGNCCLNYTPISVK